MNVPSRSSYQSTCVTRTVQSIDKNKMKLAGIKKCPCPPLIVCIPPTSTTIGICTSAKCNEQCNGTNRGSISIIYDIMNPIPSPPLIYQWYWIDGSGVHHAFADGNNISGSQTNAICLTQPGSPSCLAYNIYCIYSNNCGTITTNTYSTCFVPNT